MNIRETILEQNSHWYKEKRQIKFVLRDIADQIKLKSNFIEVITGPRRSGKSTIFNILIDQIIKSGQAEQKEILLLNFDNPNFIPFYKNVAKLDEIIQVAEVLAGNKIKYLFLDEIQNIEIWEKWVKAKYDQKIFKKIFITGSNSNLLTGQYISRLSGRFFEHMNLPFSFSEFLKSQKIEYFQDEAKNYPKKNKIISLFNQYLEQGGFPEVSISGDKEILKIYYQTILLKDVIDNNKIRDSYNLKHIALFLISNIAGFYSFNKIGKELDIHENTVKEYIEYLNNSFLFMDLKKYDPSVRKQNKNKRKIYCVDNGLVSQIGFKFSSDSGHFLENLVAVELKRRGQEIFYHNAKHECDFLIKDGRNIVQAIQVCYEINNKNKNREYKGLLEAMAFHRLKKGFIITNNQEDNIFENKMNIILIPAWKWLLSN
ncbi:MAG: ATP-binding protein [Patescibacteria group bacterium]|nr:ATP-binding protein [Patescibacteria group bacterium]